MPGKIFESEPHRLVDDLSEINLDHYHNGRKVREHLDHTVMECQRGWAFVLIAYRAWSAKGWTGTEYRIERWRRLGGAWRYFSHFPLRGRHLMQLAEAGPLMIYKDRQRAA